MSVLLEREFVRPEPPASIPRRAESRPCRGCGLPIQPGQLYLPAGPLHVYCGLEARS